MNLYSMKLGDSVWSSEMQSNVLRVPGGWLFRSADGDRDVYTAQTFVPFNNEFMEIPVSAESPATDRQHTQAKMPSLQEFIQWALHEQNDYRTNDEIYAYFARHFGCA